MYSPRPSVMAVAVIPRPLSMPTIRTPASGCFVLASRTDPDKRRAGWASTSKRPAPALRVPTTASVRARRCFQSGAA